MKILTIVGARPQFIKAATVSRVIRDTVGVAEYLVHTGQHYDKNMSDVFFDDLDIPRPNKNLSVGSGSHGAQTGEMLAAIETEIVGQNPDWVLVYGDTNSTLAGAIAAAKLNVPVCHVEAGLRSFNRAMPEEINRILTDHASDLLFAPTRNAVEQLEREGITGEKVYLSGDVMFDAALYYKDKARERQTLSQLGLEENNYILTTIHRAENTDSAERLERIVRELKSVAEHYPIVFPLHPRTRNRILELGLDLTGINCIDPVGFLDMVKLEMGAKLIVTDSGGVQKEAYFHQKPCITLRAETEWVELVEGGVNYLYPPVAGNSVALMELIRDIEDTKSAFEELFYGDGCSARKIIGVLTGASII